MSFPALHFLYSFKTVLHLTGFCKQGSGSHEPSLLIFLCLGRCHPEILGHILQEHFVAAYQICVMLCTKSHSCTGKLLCRIERLQDWLSTPPPLFLCCLASDVMPESPNIHQYIHGPSLREEEVEMESLS